MKCVCVCVFSHQPHRNHALCPPLLRRSTLSRRAKTQQKQVAECGKGNKITAPHSSNQVRYDTKIKQAQTNKTNHTIHNTTLYCVRNQESRSTSRLHKNEQNQRVQSSSFCPRAFIGLSIYDYTTVYFRTSTYGTNAANTQYISSSAYA